MRKVITATLTSTTTDVDLQLDQNTYYRIRRISGIVSAMNVSVPLDELLSTRIQLTSKPGTNSQTREIIQISANQLTFAGNGRATMPGFDRMVEQTGLTPIMLGKTAKIRFSSSATMVGQSTTIYLDYDEIDLSEMDQAKLSSLYPP